MNKEQISDFLFDLNIQRFKINDNFDVDIHESISLQGMGLTELPFKFGSISGYFDCYNNKLTDLGYLPKVINKSIDFRFNDLISNIFLSNIKGDIYTSIIDNGVKLSEAGRVLNKDVFIKLNKRSSIIKEILRNKKVI